MLGVFLQAKIRDIIIEKKMKSPYSTENGLNFAIIVRFYSFSYKYIPNHF